MLSTLPFRTPPARWLPVMMGLLVLGTAPAAMARDLEGRLGLGYNAEFANIHETNGVPGVSLKYAFTRDVAAEAVFGISTSSPTNSVTAVKFFKTIFFETNLNFYAMLGGGILSGGGNAGSEFLGGLGCEFFIPGVESLGLSIETGGSLDNLTGSFALKTLGVSLLDAGVHFYF